MNDYKKREASDEEELFPAHEKAAAWPGKRSFTDTLEPSVGYVARKAYQLLRALSGGPVSRDPAHAVAQAAESAGQPLPDELRGRFESSLGADLGGVRLHTGVASGAAAEAVGARAYTTGQDIHFNDGEYQPSSADGQRLLAHEVAHTVQQRGAPPATQHKLEVSSPGDSSEREADHAAEAMVAGQAAAVTGISSSVGRMVQRDEKTNWDNDAQAAVRTWHQQDINVVDTALQLMATGKGVHAANTAQCVKQGRIKIHVYTKTHDSAARAAANKMTGLEAYFGHAVAWPNDSDYDAADVNSIRNILFMQPGLTGRAGEGILRLIEPSKLAMEGTDGLIPTLVHESQHMLDHHEEGSDPWARYQTEFRAYWIDGTFKGFSATDPAGTESVKDGPPLEGFKNQRQVQIAKQLIDGMTRIGEGWKADAAFRDKVKGYGAPEGLNLVNSPGIEALYQLVAKPAAVDAIKGEVGKLTSDDKLFLQNAAMKGTWQALLDQKLSKEDAATVKGLLGI